jgi:hypothetical protein
MYSCSFSFSIFIIKMWISLSHFPWMWAVWKIGSPVFKSLDMGSLATTLWLLLSPSFHLAVLHDSKASDSRSGSTQFKSQLVSAILSFVWFSVVKINHSHFLLLHHSVTLQYHSWQYITLAADRAVKWLNQSCHLTHCGPLYHLEGLLKKWIKQHIQVWKFVKLKAEAWQEGALCAWALVMVIS